MQMLAQLTAASIMILSFYLNACSNIFTVNPSTLYIIYSLSATMVCNLFILPCICIHNCINIALSISSKELVLGTVFKLQ